MWQLLKIEWLKVRYYKAFWVFTILYFVSLFGINYIGFYINELAHENVPMGSALLGTPYSFPRVWGTVGFMSSWLLYFPGILFIMLMTNEYNFKTHRQNIIDGWERTQFINVKFTGAFIYAVLITVLNFVVALVFGLMSASSSFTWDGIEKVGYIFLQSLTYIAFAMFLSVVFRRSGLAIAIFFLYGLIFEWLFTTFINLKLDMTPVGYFLPLQTSDSLLPLPFGKEFIYKGLPHDWVMVLAVVIYTGLYYFFSLKKFTKDDL
ncbi:MAG: ABC transporter permease [Chitinophagaceae bacterium]|nr:ABC transporter permease [Chitinophagaceae bacterium]